MKRQILFALFLCLFASEALAKPRGKRLAKNEKKKTVVVQNEEAPRDESSEANRKDKNVSLTFDVLSAVTGLGWGAAGGYYLSPNAIAEIEYEQLALSSSLLDLKAQVATLRMKQFLGNSFYLNYGASYWTYDFSGAIELYDSTSTEEPKRIAFSTSSSNIGLDLAIGNRWQWDNFTMGCDWVGGRFPVSSTSKGDFEIDGATDEEERDAEKTFKDLTTKFQAYFLNFYVGVSF